MMMWLAAVPFLYMAIGIGLVSVAEADWLPQDKMPIRDLLTTAAMWPFILLVAVIVSLAWPRET